MFESFEETERGSGIKGFLSRYAGPVRDTRLAEEQIQRIGIFFMSLAAASAILGPAIYGNTGSIGTGLVLGLAALALTWSRAGRPPCSSSPSFWPTPYSTSAPPSPGPGSFWPPGPRSWLLAISACGKPVGRSSIISIAQFFRINVLTRRGVTLLHPARLSLLEDFQIRN